MKKVLDLEYYETKDKDGFPMAYQHPKYSSLRWFCSRDEEGKITSVTIIPENPTQICYLESAEKAREIRDSVISEGWVEAQKPKLSFTTD